MVRAFQNKFHTRPSPFRLMPLPPVSCPLHLTLEQYENTFGSLNTISWGCFSSVGLVWSLWLCLTCPPLDLSTWSVCWAVILQPFLGPASLLGIPWPSLARFTFSSLWPHYLIPTLLKLWVSLIIWGHIAWTFAVMNCKNCHSTVSIQIRNPP